MRRKTITDLQDLDTYRRNSLPPNARRVVDRASGCVAFLYTDKRGRPCAAAWKRRAMHPSWRYYFRSEAVRAQRVSEFLASSRAGAKRRAEERARRKAPHSLEVGTILRCSWGYDQTNIDWFEVTATTPHTVKVREIAAVSVETDYMQGKSRPLMGDYIGPETTHRVGADNYVRISECQLASPWDGNAANWTSYA